MSDLIARLEALEKEATPGPWEVVHDGESLPIVDTPEGMFGLTGLIGSHWQEEVAALIVELRNALPAILHALKVQEAAEAWEPLYQTVTYGEPKFADHKEFEQAERALVAAVKGEQK